MFCVWVSSLSYDQFTWLWMIVFADFSGLVQLIDSEELVDTQSSTARVLVLLKAFFQAIWYQGFMFLIFTSKTFLKRRGGGYFIRIDPEYSGIYRSSMIKSIILIQFFYVHISSVYQLILIEIRLFIYYFFIDFRFEDIANFIEHQVNVMQKCVLIILFPAGCISSSPSSYFTSSLSHFRFHKCSFSTDSSLTSSFSMWFLFFSSFLLQKCSFPTYSSSGDSRCTNNQNEPKFCTKYDEIDKFP